MPPQQATGIGQQGAFETLQQWPDAAQIGERAGRLKNAWNVDLVERRQVERNMRYPTHLTEKRDRFGVRDQMPVLRGLKDRSARCGVGDLDHE